MKIFIAGIGTIYSTFKWSPKVYGLLGGENHFYSYFEPDVSMEATKKISSPIKICDSGAHSFFTAEGIGATHGIRKTESRHEDPDRYLIDYIKWMIKNWKHYDYFVELDLQSLVGIDKVAHWRSLYKKAQVSSKIIYVHHTVNTWKEFEEIVDLSECRYIAIEGKRSGIPMLPYEKYIEYCYHHNCKIHGFALVQPKIMYKYPFASVDSSSLSYSYRRGLALKWDDKKKIVKMIRVPGRRDCTQSQKETYFKFNVPTKYESLSVSRAYQTNNPETVYKLMEDAVYAVNQQEKFFTELWKKRGVDWDGK